MLYARQQRQKGVLLLEVLIALALFLAIATIIAQALSVGFASERAARTRSIATATLEELLTQVRASSEEHWDNVAGLPRGVAYSVTASSGVISIIPGAQQVNIDGVVYARSFTVLDVQRSFASTTAPLSFMGTSSVTQVDRGTVIVDGLVSWGSGDSLSLRSVLTRWRNIVCGQTSWSTTGSSTVDCTSPTISLGSVRNIQVGNTLQLCSGC
jgi:type II secretory pathway pseudopilin PulG